MRPSIRKSPSASRGAIRKGLFAGIAGLSLAGTVAGCAPSTADSTPGTAGAPAAPSAGSSSLAASGASYKDGTYNADGNYVSPNGTETVGVQLTLAAGNVTDVQITQHPSNPNTRKFQGQFAGGIAAQVVGKNIDELNVSKVAGSSLTSGGFNQALEKIKAEAQ
ncbi:FMN-binding protein [Pseudarthrobacter sp. alpha12b]